MSKSVYILLFVCDIIRINALSESEPVIQVYRRDWCSNSMVLHEGSGWVLVKAEMPIDTVNCDNNGHNLNWHGKINQLSFPDSKIVLMFLKNVDKSFAGSLHCMFIGPPPNGKVITSCTIQVQVLGKSTSKYSSVPGFGYRNNDDCHTGFWIAITVLMNVVYIGVLVAVIYKYYYKTKVTSSKNNTIRPLQKLPTEFTMDRYGDKPLPNTPDKMGTFGRFEQTSRPSQQRPFETIMAYTKKPSLTSSSSMGTNDRVLLWLSESSDSLEHFTKESHLDSKFGYDHRPPRRNPFESVNNYNNKQLSNPSDGVYDLVCSERNGMKIFP